MEELISRVAATAQSDLKLPDEQLPTIKRYVKRAINRIKGHQPFNADNGAGRRRSWTAFKNGMRRQAVREVIGTMEKETGKAGG